MKKAICLITSLGWIIPIVLCKECSPLNINKTNTTMGIYINPKNQNETCTYSPSICNGTIWTLGRGKNIVQFVVCEDKENNSVALKMIKRTERCGQKVWITNRPGYVVSSNKTLGNTMKNNKNNGRYKPKIENNELQSDIKNRVYEDMVQACQIKKLQNRNIIDLLEESPIAFYLTIFVLSYILWKIVTSIFGVLVNCCTLRRVNRRRNSCCCSYIFCAMCSSLTNRHISLNQQHDIDSLKLDLYGGRGRDEIKSVNSEFVYVDCDLYGCQ